LAGPPPPGRSLRQPNSAAFLQRLKVSALEELALTENPTLGANRPPGCLLTQLVKSGTLVHAKREFLNHNKYSAADGDSECALLRSGSGVAGLADAWIQATYQVMADAKLPIIPPSSPPDTPTALRWLKIHHPELLVNPEEASAAPVAVAPEPKPATPEAVQKPAGYRPKEAGHR
jgi:hypothetical protein